MLAGYLQISPPPYPPPQAGEGVNFLACRGVRPKHGDYKLGHGATKKMARRKGGPNPGGSSVQLEVEEAIRIGVAGIGAQWILSSTRTHLLLPLRLKSTRCLPFSMETLNLSSAKAAELARRAAIISVLRILFMVCSSKGVSCWRDFTSEGDVGALNCYR
jgi:hypothetical protein